MGVHDAVVTYDTVPDVGVLAAVLVSPVFDTATDRAARRHRHRGSGYSRVCKGRLDQARSCCH